MSLNFTNICHNIAALDVTGINKICDLHEIPESVVDRDCPLLYPNPEGFVSELVITVDSFGSAEAAKTVTYLLTYRFLEASLSTERCLFDLYGDFVKHVFAVLDKLIDSDALAGLIDLQVEGITAFGPVTDPSGNGFHGCDLVLRIMEFVN